MTWPERKGNPSPVGGLESINGVGASQFKGRKKKEKHYCGGKGDYDQKKTKGGGD